MLKVDSSQLKCFIGCPRCYKYKYLEIKCFKCKGSLVFGQTQEDPNTFYLRKDKETKKYDWKPYNPEVSE